MSRKRGNGEGTVYPRRGRDGRITGYRGAYWVHTAEGPKRRYVYGKTKTDAKTALRKAIADRDEGLVLEVNNQTLSEYLDMWLENSVKGSVGHRTYHSYRAQIRNHIKPALGTIKLRTLSPAHIQGFYRAKLDSGLSTSSVRYSHAVLHRALKQATRWGLVARNICEMVDPPRVRHKEVDPLTSDQARALLEAVRGDRHEALYAVAIACGLRQGELLGLMRTDADLDARTLRVERQLQRMRDGSGLAFAEPKNASRRTVQLPSWVATRLEEHLERQKEEMELAGGLYRDQGLLFTSQIGTPLDAQNLVNRDFKPLLRKAGLPGIRFHDLRHTCATLLLVKGIHPKLVQTLLGHSSIKITLDTYSHWFPELGDHTADAMDDLF